MDKPNLVVHKSDSNLLDFEDLLEQSQPLKDLSMNSENKVSNLLTDLASDIHTSLLRSKPVVKEDNEIRKSRLINKAVIDEMLETSEYYHELHPTTEGDPVSAGMGTLSIAPWIIENVEEFDNAEELSQLEEDIESLSLLADTLDQYKEGKEKAKEIRVKVSDMEQDFQEKYNVFYEKVQCSKDKIRDALREICQQQAEAGEAISSMKGWGSAPGHFCQMDIATSVKLAEMVMRSENLKKIAELAGKLISFAMFKQRTKADLLSEELMDVHFGNNINYLLPSEIAFLKFRRIVFYKKYVEKQQLQYKLQGKEKKAKGPIVVPIDQSGSMQGEPEIWSKAFFLALQAVAAKDNRDIYYVPFGKSLGEIVYLKDGKASPLIIAEMLSNFMGHGGTDFHPPLKKAMEIIKEKEKDADICFITDGYASINESFIKNFMNFKASKETSFYLILVEEGENSFGEIPDKVINITMDNVDPANEVFSKI